MSEARYRELVAEVLSLSAGRRGELADRVLESLGPSDESLFREYAAIKPEIDRRRAEAADGLNTEPVDDLLSRVQAKIDAAATD